MNETPEDKLARHIKKPNLHDMITIINNYPNRPTTWHPGIPKYKHGGQAQAHDPVITKLLEENYWTRDEFIDAYGRMMDDDNE
jgi:hypothetical protein